MFDTLSKRLGKIFDKLSGRGVLSEKDVDATLREIRIALLEADVALPVAKEFVEKIREDAVGQNVIKSVSPGQMVVKIVFDQLLKHLSAHVKPIELKGSKPMSILMAGLQGSGKTTTTAKLALLLSKEPFKKKVLVVSLDIYRPAAQEQLEQLAKKANIMSLPIVEGENVMAICKRGFDYAYIHDIDVILFDTAGRLHVDASLMDEIKQIKAAVKPVEILLVADAMTGQDAVTIASEFHEALGLTGVILTRVDGDARGGAALSISHVTNCPIKFMGVGEKLDQLETFDPERVASRILDMGDILSLVERAQSSVQKEEAEKMQKRMEKGKFDLDDMANYLTQMENMGGIMSLLKMMPGFGRMEEQIKDRGIDDKMLKRQVGIIRSMTPKERRDYKILNGLRRRRIAIGAGVEVSEVNKLIKQYEDVKNMMQKMGMFGKGNFGQGLFSGINNKKGF